MHDKGRNANKIVVGIFGGLGDLDCIEVYEKLKMPDL
jgi:hypothetical protein